MIAVFYITYINYHLQLKNLLKNKIYYYFNFLFNGLFRKITLCNEISKPLRINLKIFTFLQIFNVFLSYCFYYNRSRQAEYVHIAQISFIEFRLDKKGFLP